jgi:hypothetical protein
LLLAAGADLMALIVDAPMTSVAADVLILLGSVVDAMMARVWESR